MKMHLRGEEAAVCGERRSADIMPRCLIFKEGKPAARRNGRLEMEKLLPPLS
jgi:hypothetical protein